MSEYHSIEVKTHLGEAIYEEMIETRWLAEKERREILGWSMSGHGYLSLKCYFIESKQRIQTLDRKFEIFGLPIFLHSSSQPFTPLFSPEDAGRMEYEARKMGGV